MEKRRIIELRGKAQTIQATVHIGKQGISETIITELGKQLKKNKLVKIKLLQSVEDDRKDLATRLARETCSVLIETRGRTVVLAKE